MKCPRCGKELKRSSKNPEYGLCHNCRKKYRWREEPVKKSEVARKPKQTPKKIEYEPMPENQERFKTFRLIIGILSIVLFLFITLQSCAAGVANTLSANGEVSGSAGFMLGFLMMIAGIVTICLRKHESIPAFVVPAVLYFLGAVLGAANVGTYSDLAIWSVLSAIFSSLHILFLFICKEKTIIGIIIAIVIIAIIGGFVATSSKGGTFEKDNSSGESEQGQTDDGVINFDGTGYNITLTSTQVGTDYEGKQCIYVYYTFTNNGDQATSPAAASLMQAFQNGVEEETAITMDSSAEMDNYFNEVQPGASSNVCQIFTLTDNSDVTIQVSDFISTDDSKDTQVIKLQ